MESTFTYGDAIDHFTRLLLPPALYQRVVNITEHHVLNHLDLSNQARSDITAMVTEEIARISQQANMRNSAALGQAILAHIQYWKGTARMRHGTFDAPGDRRLTAHETDRLFAVLTHIAGEFERAAMPLSYPYHGSVRT